MLGLVFSGLGLSPASATMTSCGYDNTMRWVTFQTVTPATVRLFVDSNDEIKWSDPNSAEIGDCGKATVNNTNKVQIEDYNTTADHVLIIDTRRPFAPGFTPEGGAISEIEFELIGGDGDNTLQIWGSKRKDHLVSGEEGIALNSDSDKDVFYAQYSELLVRGKGRADHLSGAGGNGTGGPSTFPLTVYGNGGADKMYGGEAVDRLLGSAGDDWASGGPAGDIMFGDDGADVLLGRGGGDELDGLQGADTLRGHGGPDDLEGGAGIDNCKGGPGTDTVQTCELP